MRINKFNVSPLQLQIKLQQAPEGPPTATEPDSDAAKQRERLPSTLWVLSCVFLCASCCQPRPSRISPEFHQMFIIIPPECRIGAP